jgi:hypothetical protein
MILAAPKNIHGRVLALMTNNELARKGRGVIYGRAYYPGIFGQELKKTIEDH